MNLPYYFFVLAACLAAPSFCEPTGRECNAAAQDCVEELASVSLLQTDLTVSQISPHRAKDEARKKGKSEARSKTDSWEDLQEFAMLQHSTHPLAVGKLSDDPVAESPSIAMLQHSADPSLVSKLPEVAGLQQGQSLSLGSATKASSVSLYLARAHKMLQHVCTGTGAVVMIVLLAMLALILVGGAPGLIKHIDPYGWYRVDKLLMNSNAPAPDPGLPGRVPEQPPLRDPRVPPSVPPSLPGAQSMLSASGIKPAQASSAPVLPTPSAGGGFGLGSFMGSLFGPTTGPTMMERVNPPAHLMPELVVQDPGGAQFFIDGMLGSQEQNGVASVSKITANQDHQQVIKIQMSEGFQGPDGHQNGIILELPRLASLPLAFINTQFALPRNAQGHNAAMQGRHCVIFDTFNHGLDFKTPFAMVAKENRGVTLRRVSGEVICIVTTGGYNTDFGNIVDDKGRLLATLSNRGHGLTGMGLVRGQWKENRRSVQIAEGVDVSIIVAAIICAAKLN